jgi:hypothetical protein
MELEFISRFEQISWIEEKFDREVNNLKQIVNADKFGFVILRFAEASKEEK